MIAWLVDTGPLVAFFDEGDMDHERVVPVFRTPPAVLWTTMPVITETMYFMRHSPNARTAFIEFLRKTKMRIESYSSFEEVEKCTALMAKYRSFPMDFADASLVLLAEKLGVFNIVTTDERGFRAFKTRTRQAFHLVLDDFPG